MTAITESGLKKPHKAILAEVIYYHPRHLEHGRVYKYDKADDIYSLGICLLEIGLWRSLLHWGEVDDWYVIGEDWGLQGPRYMGADGRKDPKACHTRRGHFIKLAKDLLPVTMSSAYAGVVLACLSFREGARKSEFNTTTPFSFIDDVLTPLLSLK